VRRARDASRARRTTSLEDRRGRDDDAPTISETVGAEEPGFETAEHGATLDLLLGCLSPRDREIVRLRFSEDLTQAEISWRVHLSQMQVSRVLRACLERLQAVAAATA
jgi:RNA polymerase sigma-B factor